MTTATFLQRAKARFIQSIAYIKQITAADLEQLLTDNGYIDLKVKSCKCIGNHDALLFAVTFIETPNFKDIIDWGTISTVNGEQLCLEGTIQIVYDAARGEIYVDLLTSPTK